MKPHPSLIPYLSRIATMDNEAPAAMEIIATMDNANPGVLVVPYGVWPNKGVKQLLNKSAAQNMARMQAGGDSTWEWAKRVLVNGFNKMWGKPIPVVIGHPSNTWSAPSYGNVTKIEAMDNEMRLHTDWKPEGTALVAGAAPRYRKFSPRFKVRVVGDVAHPFAIEHVCLTNNPAIPGATIGTLDNESAALMETVLDESDFTAVDLDNDADMDGDGCTVAVPVAPLTSVREKLGLAPDSTMEQVDAAVKGHGAALEVHKADLAKHKADHAVLEKQLADEKTANAAKIATKDNELKTRTHALLESCLKALQQQGRLKASDYSKELERIEALDNEAAMTTALAGIAARPVVIQTRSLMAGAARGARIATLSNEAGREDRLAAEKRNAVETEKQRLIRSGLSESAAFDKAFASVHRPGEVA